MLKKDVLAYIEKKKLTQTEIGVSLGISQPAISKWPDLVPELRAIELAELTGGELVYKRSDYRREPKVA